MTISDFASGRSVTSWDGFGSPVRRAYREQKRRDAEGRQAAFDAEVTKVAREQNCLPETARDVVMARRRFEQRTGLGRYSLRRVP